MSRQLRRSLASREFDTSYAQLLESSPHVVLRRFLTRHDHLVEQVTADSAEQKACARGCASCCHFKVVADAVEVFAMVDYVREHLQPQQIDRIIGTAKKNVQQARPLSHRQQLIINQPCPFLLDDSCLVYPLRTIKCRNFHATDSSSCRASYERPDDLSILNPSITQLYIAATSSSDGFLAALHTCGYDDHIYDLNGAFVEAFEDPACRHRYDRGKRAFRSAKHDND